MVFYRQEVKFDVKMNLAIALVFFVETRSICQLKAINTEKNGSRVVYLVLYRPTVRSVNPEFRPFSRNSSFDFYDVIYYGVIIKFLRFFAKTRAKANRKTSL